MRTFIFALIAGSLPVGAYATGSFSGSQPTEPLTRYTAIIESATYSGSIFVSHGADRFEVALGTPSFIKAKGLPLSALAPGKTVMVDAFDSKADSSDKLYARRIVVDGRIFDLR